MFGRATASVRSLASTLRRPPHGDQLLLRDPKDERAALVAAQPEKFFMPIPSDMRYNWVQVWLEAIDEAEMRELVIDAWRIVVRSGLPTSI